MVSVAAPDRPMSKPARRGRSRCTGFVVLAAGCAMLSRGGAAFFSQGSAAAVWYKPVLNAEGRARHHLLYADAVCFDVDSTVVQTEGIDLLARCHGVGEAVANLTKSAMEGGSRYEDALAARLRLMRPTADSISRCIRAEGAPAWSPGIAQLMHRLRHRGVDIFLVSGGFRSMIKPVAIGLDIDEDHVFANSVVFDDDGKFAGVDTSEPTCRDGGKAEVIKRIRGSFSYRNIVIIGDGVTDLQARPPATAFIGYGGVQVRSKVQHESDWFVTDFFELLDSLPEPQR